MNRAFKYANTVDAAESGFRQPFRVVGREDKKRAGKKLRGRSGKTLNGSSGGADAPAALSKQYRNWKASINPFECPNASALGSIKNGVIDNKMAILILDESGYIKHCNKTSALLLDWQRTYLLSRHVSDIFPQLAKTSLFENMHVNSKIRFLSRVGHHFDAHGQHGERFKCELFFNHKAYAGADYLQLIVHPLKLTAC
ncbi:hypothetical protein [Methylomonas sp. MgM2]